MSASLLNVDDGGLLLQMITVLIKQQDSGFDFKYFIRIKIDQQLGKECVNWTNEPQTVEVCKEEKVVTANLNY